MKFEIGANLAIVLTVLIGIAGITIMMYFIVHS